MSRDLNQEFYDAACSGDVAAAETALKSGAALSWTPCKASPAIQKATRFGHSAVVQLLLENGADINLVDRSGQSLLSHAVLGGNLHTVELLLERGAEIDRRCMDGKAPIHHAASRGRLDMMKALISKGGNPCILTNLDMSPLHFAAQNGHKDAVELSLSYGCEIDAVDSVQRTALHLAASDGRDDMINLLLDKGADINRKCSLGRSALFYAINHNYLGTVEVLIQRGATVDTSDKRWDTPLHLVAARRNVTAFYLILHHLVATVSTKKICELVNKPNTAGQTPLHLAAAESSPDILDALLRRGADINAVDNMHATPLQLAIRRLRVDNVRRLLICGAAIPPKVLDGFPFDVPDDVARDSVIALLCSAGACIKQ